MLSRLARTCKFFYIKIYWHQRSAQVCGIAIIGGILACLLIPRDLTAAEIQKNVLVIEVTEANFEEIQRRLKNDNPLITSLNMRFILKTQQLEQLNNAIESNTELGYILWHKDQGLSEDLENIENKLRNNNLNYQYHPNDYIHALLSAHTYINAKMNDAVIFEELSLDDNTKEILKDWRVEKVHNFVQENGYYGVIYKNDKTHQIVLANRGTEGGAMDVINDLLKRHSDWNTNLKEILIGQILVCQQARNYEATEEAIKIAQELGYRLSFSGHSLGAWLAELSAFYSYAYFNFLNIKVVTFDSPGALPMMKILESNMQNKQMKIDFNDINIVTYLGRLNPVNCCNEHMGRVFQVEVALVWGDWIYNRLPRYIKNSVIKKIQSLLGLEGDPLRGIIEIFDPVTGKPKEYKRVEDWPRVEYKGDPNKVFFDPKDAFSDSMINGLSAAWPVNEMGGKIETKVFNYIIGDATLMPLIDVLLSQIDQRQYWVDYENFEGEQRNDREFVFLAKEKYRDDSHSYVLNIINDSLDKYLYELYKCREKLEKRDDLSGMDKAQLEDLVRQFTIEESMNDGKYQLIPNENFDVETIRQKARRLFSVLPKSTIESLSMNIDSMCEIGDRFLSDNIPWQETIYYIWMDDQEEELAINLNKRSVAVISGIGGIGKSTLAATYARNCKQSGWQARWIKGMQIEEEFLQLAKDMNLTIDNLSPQEVRDLIYNDFAKSFQGQEILLIFDNVEDKEKLKQYLINLPDNIKIIITGRKSDLVEGIKSIKLRGFNKEQAILYVQKALDKDQRESEKLVETVGESPFRLLKAVTYLKNHDLMSIDEFLSEYEAIKMGGNKNAEIYPEVELLFKDLKKKESNRPLILSLIDTVLSLFLIDIDVDSWELLKYLAYLDAEGVSLKLIESITGEDKDELQYSINELEQLSLVNVVIEGDQTKLKISHRIIQGEIKKALIEEDKNQIRGILEELMRALNKVLPFIDENPENWKELTELVGHAKAFIKEKAIPTIRREELLRKIGYFYYYIVCDCREAISYWNEALKYQKRIYKKNNPKIADSLNDLGIAYYALGGKENIHKGLKYFEESFKLKRTLFPRNHRRVAASLNNIGIAYYALGEENNMSKGSQYLEEALKIFFPGNDSNAADFFNNVGLTDEDQELKHKEDVSTMKNALFLSNQALGEKEIIRKRLKYFGKSLKMNQSLFPSNHLSVAGALYNLGNAYLKLEDQGKGLEYYKQAYGIYSNLFGEDYEKIQAIKSYIESVQAQFFVTE